MPGLAPEKRAGSQGPRVSSISGTTEAETQEREQGWLEDQKKTGQSKKESRTSSRGRRVGFQLSSLTGKGRIGPRDRSGTKPIFRVQIV